MCGDDGIGAASEFLDIGSGFSDDDTTMRVSEGDGVSGHDREFE